MIKIIIEIITKIIIKNYYYKILWKLLLKSSLKIIITYTNSYGNYLSNLKWHPTWLKWLSILLFSLAFSIKREREGKWAEQHFSTIGNRPRRWWAFHQSAEGVRLHGCLGTAIPTAHQSPININFTLSLTEGKK